MQEFTDDSPLVIDDLKNCSNCVKNDTCVILATAGKGFAEATQLAPDKIDVEELPKFIFTIADKLNCKGFIPFSHLRK